MGLGVWLCVMDWIRLDRGCTINVIIHGLGVGWEIRSLGLVSIRIRSRSKTLDH